DDEDQLDVCMEVLAGWGIAGTEPICFDDVVVVVVALAEGYDEVDDDTRGEVEAAGVLDEGDGMGKMVSVMVWAFPGVKKGMFQVVALDVEELEVEAAAPDVDVPDETCWVAVVVLEKLEVEFEVDVEIAHDVVHETEAFQAWDDVALAFQDEAIPLDQLEALEAATKKPKMFARRILRTPEEAVTVDPEKALGDVVVPPDKLSTLVWKEVSHTVDEAVVVEVPFFEHEQSVVVRVTVLRIVDVEGCAVVDGWLAAETGVAEGSTDASTPDVAPGG
ncbi:MAG: hypothetical protein Q9218_007086, partial [Villophora microphyllina]